MNSALSHCSGNDKRICQHLVIFFLRPCSASFCLLEKLQDAQISNMEIYEGRLEKQSLQEKRVKLSTLPQRLRLQLP